MRNGTLALCIEDTALNTVSSFINGEQCAKFTGMDAFEVQCSSLQSRCIVRKEKWGLGEKSPDNC